MSSPAPTSKVAKLGIAALVAAIGTGLVSIIPGLPTVASALTFVGIFGVGAYETVKDML